MANIIQPPPPEHSHRALVGAAIVLNDTVYSTCSHPRCIGPLMISALWKG